MLSTYQSAIRHTTLMGPTYFAKTFQRFIEIIETERFKSDKLYFIFVILTDGCIHDMTETCKLVVKMSYMPVSLIIVGIGNESFEEMQILDADTKVLQAEDGRYAARDIVQFVKLNEMRELAKVEVAEHMLSEVPHHFSDYMVLCNILPDPVVQTEKPEVHEASQLLNDHMET